MGLARNARKMPLFPGMTGPVLSFSSVVVVCEYEFVALGGARFKGWHCGSDGGGLVQGRHAVTVSQPREAENRTKGLGGWRNNHGRTDRLAELLA